MNDNLPESRQASNPLAVPEEWAELMAAFDDGSQTYRDHFGLSVPRLRSDFGRNGKGWVDELGGEAHRELTIVILAYPPSRAWWEVSLDESGGGGRPDCASHDMIAPTPGSPKPQSTLCAGCPHSKWGPNSERPACQESVNVLAYDLVGERFLWLRFQGTGLKPFQQYVSYLTSKYRMPAFAFATHVTLKEETRDKLEWLVPQFEMAETLTRERVVPLREVAGQAMQYWQQIAEEMAETEAGPFDGAVETTGTTVETTGTTVETTGTTVYVEGGEPF